MSKQVWDAMTASKSVSNVDTRKETCPLYHLLFHPHVCYDVEDQFGRIVIHQIPFVDRVLQTMMDICIKRIGRELQQDPLISRVFTECSKRETSVEIKQLLILLLIVIDNSCCEFFKSLYTHENGPDMARFKRNYPYICHEVNAVLNSTISPLNVLHAMNYMLERVAIPACFDVLIQISSEPQAQPAARKVSNLSKLMYE